MDGPRPKGYWSGLGAPGGPGDHQHLTVGKSYRVVRSFDDHSGQPHPVGESWRFLGSSFAPYDDGLSLFVSLDGEREWRIPMWWRREGQAEVIDHLDRYIEAA